MALTYTPAPELGTKAPDFRLPATDGKTYALNDFQSAKALVVMFICNHCPYVKAVEERLVQLEQHFKGRGVSFVGISANDSVKYPEDSFENMKKKNYPFPYLFDETQEVAKAYGAVCTPDFFVYDSERRLAYRGRLDDSWKDPSQVKNEELKAAITDLLEGRKPSTEQKPSMGCSIKWKF